MFAELLEIVFGLFDDPTEVVESAPTESVESVGAGGAIDNDASTDAGSQAGAPKFGGDVLFPDGSTVTNPYQDVQHNVYPDRESYISGTNKHTLSE